MHMNCAARLHNQVLIQCFILVVLICFWFSWSTCSVTKDFQTCLTPFSFLFDMSILEQKLSFYLFKPCFHQAVRLRSVRNILCLFFNCHVDGTNRTVPIRTIFSSPLCWGTKHTDRTIKGGARNAAVHWLVTQTTVDCDHCSFSGKFTHISDSFISITAYPGCNVPNSVEEPLVCNVF